MERLRVIQNELIKVSQAWASEDRKALARAGDLREEAIRLNHAHYFEDIPAYHKLAVEEDCGEAADIETIKKKLMFSAGIFKSYEQSWLDDGEFGKMNE
jgi:hypothetical protein